MVDELAFSLRKIKKVAACVTLKLRYSDFDTHTFQTHIPYTAADHILLKKVMELFKKNYRGKPLIRLIGIHIHEQPVPIEQFHAVMILIHDIAPGPHPYLIAQEVGIAIVLLKA